MFAPEVPDEVTGAELDREVRKELSSLSKDTARDVARHLVMTARLLDDEPELAWLHAIAARDRAARLPSVREAAGLAAYRTGRYAEALAELRTARRLTGSSTHLPIMADCERGLGRPERALALAVSPEAHSLDLEGRVEILIVAAGARSDLGQDEAAVVTLHVPQLRTRARAPWVARLRSAYADALAAVGRDEEARHWLAMAADVDEDGSTGAAERLAELDGVTFVDSDDDLGDDDAEADDAEADDAAAEGAAAEGAAAHELASHGLPEPGDA